MRVVPALLLAASLAVATVASAGDLEDSLGRTEVRITSEAYPLFAGRTVDEMHLPERLERLGYTRVHERPTAPGQFFWGTDVFWVYRRAHRRDGAHWEALLVGLQLDSQGRVLAGLDAEGLALDLGRRGLWLEPELLAESLEGDRAPRRLVDIAELPAHVWYPLLALEDSRFFEHSGVDGRAIARAAVENVKAGEVTQGASTITQQLVKNRDLTPKRSLDRKASEAMRALALEAEYDKHEILQAYLNTVYYGHVDGVAVHGIGTASQVFFSKPAAELTLAEAATLAAIVQGPNGLSPIRHPEAAVERRDRAISRMVELGWLTEDEAVTVRATPLVLHLGEAAHRSAPHFRDFVVRTVQAEETERMDKGLGFAAETSLDPILQAHAEAVLEAQLAALRRDHRSLRDADLTGALVALDAESGAILAHVGGDPAVRDSFDRASRALRQPGSTVKPLVALEAFDGCGARDPVHPAVRISDAPLHVELPSGTWSPENYDHRDHGTVDVRTALVKSYNRPFARLALYCGLEPTAARMEHVGLVMPEPLPPSLALGAVETSPLQLAGAFTPFVTLGRAATPYGVLRVERPGGRKLHRERSQRRRVSADASAWLVRDLLVAAVEEGTGTRAAVPGLEVLGKTGTTADDAWFVGAADGVVVVVWIGRDGGGELGLTGGKAAAPVAGDFLALAAPARPPHLVEVPFGVVSRYVDPDTGLLVGAGNADAREEHFRRGYLPRRDAFWRADDPMAVIR